MPEASHCEEATASSGVARDGSPWLPPVLLEPLTVNGASYVSLLSLPRRRTAVGRSLSRSTLPGLRCGPRVRHPGKRRIRALQRYRFGVAGPGRRLAASPRGAQQAADCDDARLMAGRCASERADHRPIVRYRAIPGNTRPRGHYPAFTFPTRGRAPSR